MDRSNIVLWGGNGFRNMGDEFVDLGSKYMIEKSSGYSVSHVSSVPKSFLTRGYFPSMKHIDLLINGNITSKKENLLDVRKHAKDEYIVTSGCVLTPGWLKKCLDNYDQYSEKKIIFNGVGGGNYSSEEVREVKKILKDIKPYAIITRDEKAYKHYKKDAKYTHNGIDCAFFINDYFDSLLDLKMGDYITFCFDKTKNTPSSKKYNRKVIHTHHSANSLTGLIKNIVYTKLYTRRGFDQKSTLVSDLPTEYLSVYLHTEETHSDRVHACLPTLLFGNEARLYNDTERSLLFDRVGIKGIKERLVKLDIDRLNDLKDSHLEFLGKIMRE